ncbi:MAG: hypothetical protein ACJAT5_001106 [Lentimonas sp.]|jgi:uncharacterized protein (DUF2235 family)
MNNRIVICSDGTWNRPEENLKKDFPTNVLKFARAIRPNGADGVCQQVFYDWGIGTYYKKLSGGAFGKGLHKNILDAYRYIVQNYSPGDEIYLFGYSRGAYTIRCLCGLINNVGIVKRSHAALLQAAFEHYKRSSRAYAPNGEKSVEFRRKHSYESREIAFVGAWDTVGAMGIPISFLGLFEDKDEFYDTKIGSNVRVARHAMAIDEFRTDFEPTIWEANSGVDIKQVWFSGSHGDVGGGFKPDTDNSRLSDGALQWLMSEAAAFGLTFEPHLEADLRINPLAKLYKSRRSFYRVRKKFYRDIDHGKGEVLIHKMVKQRWDQNPKYRPKNLISYIEKNGWPSELVG